MATSSERVLLRLLWKMKEDEKEKEKRRR